MWLRFVGIGTLPQAGPLTLSVIQKPSTPNPVVSRTLAATEQRPTPERFDSRHRINPYPLSFWVSNPRV